MTTDELARDLEGQVPDKPLEEQNESQDTITSTIPRIKAPQPLARGATDIKLFIKMMLARIQEDPVGEAEEPPFIRLPTKETLDKVQNDIFDCKDGELSDTYQRGIESYKSLLGLPVSDTSDLKYSEKRSISLVYWMNQHYSTEVKTMKQTNNTLQEERLYIVDHIDKLGNIVNHHRNELATINNAPNTATPGNSSIKLALVQADDGENLPTEVEIYKVMKMLAKHTQAYLAVCKIRGPKDLVLASAEQALTTMKSISVLLSDCPKKSDRIGTQVAFAEERLKDFIEMNEHGNENGFAVVKDAELAHEVMEEVLGLLDGDMMKAKSGGSPTKQSGGPVSC